MTTRTFKEFLKLSGPDRINTPMLSREERLARAVSPIVVEMLERRRLFTLDVSLSGGTLSIEGTSDADIVSVYLNTGDNSIYVTDSTNTYGPYGPANISAFIKVLAGAGNDSIYINSSVSESTQFYGEAGNDRFEGGSLTDIIYGGDGADSILGLGGNDDLWGGNDSDTLDGGSGNDAIHGDAGTDTLLGNAGNDFLYGGTGNDSLDGGAGNDEVYGEADNDYINDGNDVDKLFGGDGDDSIDSGDGFGDTIDGGAGNDIASVNLSDTTTNVETIV